VLPGSYSVMAYLFEDDKRYASRLNIEVGNADLENLAILIAPGVTVSGRVLWDGPPCSLDTELRVATTQLDPGPPFGRSARVPAPAYIFPLPDLTEGAYRAWITGLSKDCFVKDVFYGGSSVIENGFNVARGSPSSLEIPLSSRSARVQ